MQMKIRIDLTLDHTKLETFFFFFETHGQFPLKRETVQRTEGKSPGELIF